MQSMACHFAHYAFSSSPNRDYCFITKCCNFKPSKPSSPVMLSSLSDRRPSYNTLVFQAVRLLGPPARFEASKLKVVFTGNKMDKYARILPRTYTLSHCDFTGNLTLSISNVISLDQLKGWYSKDDVVAEWKEVKGVMHLDVHCYVLEAVVCGDSVLFREHQELMDAIVRVYFHSSSKKYNRVECWGPLKDAAKGKREDQIHDLLSGSKESSHPSKNWGSPKSIFQALVTFLL
ncbi:magnesium dechelatase SGRL, chloroplastic isoform X2 [Cornus florida]|uniref:magnesium dechelatase SGRL, chloroplastic isoform X2 n=1 Tax=Cornus florida TaxID=4283 RepID=UPI00289CB7AA|nr:magnesium dechelatase SGRL, chloroplastic isoform X2 [Cornus florida]